MIATDAITAFQPLSNPFVGNLLAHRPVTERSFTENTTTIKEIDHETIHNHHR